MYINIHIYVYGYLLQSSSPQSNNTPIFWASNSTLASQFQTARFGINIRPNLKHEIYKTAISPPLVVLYQSFAVSILDP